MESTLGVVQFTPRKSSEEGLEQDFNSLHAQREEYHLKYTILGLPPSYLARES